MKKIISIVALLSVFTLNFAQEKESCCAGKDKKECSVKDKKACAEHHKSCDKKTKTAENTTKDKKTVKTAKKVA
ncbi:hypothetical protein [Chryseobacterium wanjuense]